ncbi:MAG TPA: hypothetical protein VLK30_14375 [Candidatus Limnocylindrales bacterium]|nr:hypothetical protein [Candidatus Limnocylindrales bacterium]
MNWGALRGEWGAVTFVLTVIAGMIVVPLALYFANVSPGAIATPTISTTSSARSSSVATPARTSPTPTPSPSASPSH